MASPYDTLPRSVGAYEDARAEVIRHLVTWVARAWPPNRPMDPALWFQLFADQYADQVVAAQLEAAVLAEWSVDHALELQHVPVADSTPALSPAAFASTDGYGRPVLGQAYASAGAVGGAAQGAIEAGGDPLVARALAWASVAESLAVATQTMVSDASRSAKSARMLARDTGWVRVLTPPSCSRCAVLAGKWHRNATAGFQRHPRCDCTQIPVSDASDPEFAGAFFEARDYFDSLSTAEQDRVFTKAGAQAIRDGADVGQVVNARRGMSTVNDKFGFRTQVTSEGTTKKGWARMYLGSNYQAKLRKQPGSRYRRTDRRRLMPEEIYRMAGGDRDRSMSLLHANGYYTDASPSLNRGWSRDDEVAAARERARKKLQDRGVRPVANL